MIVTLFLWLIVFFIFYVYGSWAFKALCHILSVKHENTVKLPLILLIGEAVVTVVAMIAQLLIPLGNGVFMAGLLICALVIALRNRHWFGVNLPSRSFLIWLLMALIFFTVVENATHIPANPDTGLYHAQSIRWFETYQIVPGLGNFEARYAFNSSWLVLNAALSFVFLGLFSFRLVNGVTFLIAMLYFFNGVFDVVDKRISITSILKVLFLPLSFYLLSSEISSVGNDMVVTFLTWIIVLLWIEKIENPSVADANNLLIVLFSLFAVTVKLSSLPLLLFSAFIMIGNLRLGNKRAVVIFSLLGAIILFPWMIRSVFMSGYLVFPQYQLDLFDVDWKMPEEDVDFAIRGIVGIARLGNSWNPSIPMLFSEWAPKWFGRFTTNRRMVIFGALLSPLLLLVLIFKKDTKISQEYIVAFLVMFINGLFWFFAAPSIRFGYGPLIALCTLAVGPFILNVFTMLEKMYKFMPLLTLLLLAGFQSYTLLFSFESSTVKQRWLLPLDYLPSETSPCDLDGLTIGCRPDGVLWTRCFYDVFPCGTLHRMDTKMRGETLQDGFRSPLPAETQQ